MRKAIIVFGSTTGTTEDMTNVVKDILTDLGDFETDVCNASGTSPEALNEYDLILLGCSTWGDGVLQDDFVAFEKKCRGTDLKGTKAAVFGPGESIYPAFCKAVEILEDTLRTCGAELVCEGLKVDVLKGGMGKKTKKWTAELLERLDCTL